MHSTLAQTYAALGRPVAARDVLLNAYRLRIELADTDPSNQFYAAQVMMSRLSLLWLKFMIKFTNSWLCRETRPTTS